MKRILLIVLITLFTVCGVGVIFLMVRYPASTSTQSSQIQKTSIASNTEPKTEKSTSIYTIADVAVHNTQDNCWLVIKGNVYDVTISISKHPGGADVIIKNCGKEVTSIFTSIHSNKAWNLLGEYLIGMYQGAK
jgi:nitrate reductase (NAD(P)H)